jgi:hypothetical protein
MLGAPQSLKFALAGLFLAAVGKLHATGLTSSDSLLLREGATVDEVLSQTERRCALISARAYPDLAYLKSEFIAYWAEVLRAPISKSIDTKRLSAACAAYLESEIGAPAQWEAIVPDWASARKDANSQPQFESATAEASVAQDRWADHFGTVNEASLASQKPGPPVIASLGQDAAKEDLQEAAPIGLPKPSLAPATEAVPSATFNFEPWPPPLPTARIQLNDAFITNTWRFKTVGDAARYLETAFRQAGYAEFGYFRTPGGFAFVTQLEHFQNDGRPMPGNDRWIIDVTPERGVIDCLLHLFEKPIGRYRFFVVILTTDPSPPSAVPASVALAKQWVVRGLAFLENQIAEAPMTPSEHAYVNIYEFEHEKEKIPNFLTSSSIDPKQQLLQANIALELSK